MYLAKLKYIPGLEIIFSIDFSNSAIFETYFELFHIHFDLLEDATLKKFMIKNLGNECFTDKHLIKVGEML